ncbi:DEAD/DEAH box helicase family protein [Pseudidiomarina sp. 1APP75-32.1]|uniref:DEAD/DEAH box helicase family protein n=1 Tax=Pseudidiomarina terrestris TaxID=2820060 RepID=A0AAW7R1U1_9GAMM|nr:MULTISPECIES: DEAD/DEAH box helicase family protein [unclassified Pseudidiomarina]MDN7125661.1 DEAD/DEAH box helicase family protein [Pseudidiomarina sp. 1APP75-32.1]MDN7130475.1 DEAD/DEAH box helicase family protein [Pseudidiomarina sp. 1APR75-15]
MDLFGPLTIKLTLPAKSAPALKVGGNIIHKLLFRATEVEAQVKEAEFAGYYELVTGLNPPLNIIYLKNPNARGKCREGVPSLKAKENFSLKNWPEDIQLNWEQFPEQAFPTEPDQINDLWRHQFHFKEEDAEHRLPGLRKPQLGALHAISGYFSTDMRVEPATVVLPTGTGKTETMLATMVYQQCGKVLLIVPSDSLRSQISKKFIDLGYLPELTVVPPDIGLPNVAIIRKGIHLAEESKRLVDAANVVVATTSVLLACSDAALNALCKECSHLFVDEAHHISAASWQAIRERFKEKRVVQFTATPFRNDKKSLGGKIIYNYTMGEAQRGGYFTNVNLLPVEEYYPERIDSAIAGEAIVQLRADIATGLAHLLMARTSNKNRAEELFNLYQNLAPDLNPIVVHSGHSKSEVKKRLDRLRAQTSKIVICVDMLGEGYDLPNLKIAALHDHHKSLAITLQFIGRFTRVSHTQNLGRATVVMNIADPAVEGELQHLYSLGADWDSVLRRLSEQRIAREVRLQEVVDALKGKGDLHEQISLWNLEPSCSAMLFKTFCDNWEPERFKENLPKFDESWHAIADDENLLVVLAVQTSPVRWGSYKDLKDTNYKVLIAHWDSDRSALFVFSNDYKAFRVEKLVTTISNDMCELVSGDKIFNIFNGIEYPLARNLGASQIGAISFTQYFGPNVTEGLSLIEASHSSLSNIAALGYEAGNRVIWGCSQRKGKVWSPQKGGSIADWCDWAKRAWDKIFSSESDPNNLTRNFLRPIDLTEPHSAYPISAQWGEYLLTAFEDKVHFYFGSVSVHLYLVEVRTAGKFEDGSVRLLFSTDDVESEYKLCLLGDSTPKGYTYQLISGPEVFVQRGESDPIPLSEYMEIDPVMIHYSDGAFSYNAHIVHVSQNIGLYAKEEIVPFDWQGTDIRKEAMGYERDKKSIQWRWFSQIQGDYDVVINDDGKGESADLVGLKIIDGSILLTLIHCKYSGANEPGARLKDLYEVCGQAQRCIRWKHLNLMYLYQHIKHREQLWRTRGYSRFLKGDIKDLVAIKERSRTTPIRFGVTIIQPGISAGQITDEGLKLLGSTALFIKKTTMADLIVVGSE